MFFIQQQLFAKLREERPSAFKKLIPVIGDTSEEGVGLPPVERQVIIERVSVIFHVAASVRFDDSMKDAVYQNVRCTRDLCILGGQMKKLTVSHHRQPYYYYIILLCTLTFFAINNNNNDKTLLRHLCT